MTKFCQVSQGGMSIGLCPFFHQRTLRQYELCLSLAPKFLCHPCQQSEKAKGHHFLPLALQRVNGLLVFRFRMNWTVGSKVTLSPALAGRIMGALEECIRLFLDTAPLLTL